MCQYIYDLIKGKSVVETPIYDNMIQQLQEIHEGIQEVRDSLRMDKQLLLKELYKKGLLYEGYKVVAYSPRTGMTLSSHEVAEGGYKEVEDFAVTIKFKLKSEPNTYLLAWTTTPWTLPGNLMLAIGAKINYVKVLYNEEYYILANSRVEEIFKGKIW